LPCNTGCRSSSMTPSPGAGTHSSRTPTFAVPAAVAYSAQSLAWYIYSAYSFGYHCCRAATGQTTPACALCLRMPRCQPHLSPLLCQALTPAASGPDACVPARAHFAGLSSLVRAHGLLPGAMPMFPYARFALVRDGHSSSLLVGWVVRRWRCRSQHLPARCTHLPPPPLPTAYAPRFSALRVASPSPGMDWVLCVSWFGGIALPYTPLATLPATRTPHTSITWTRHTFPAHLHTYPTPLFFYPPAQPPLPITQLHSLCCTLRRDIHPTITIPGLLLGPYTTSLPDTHLSTYTPPPSLILYSIFPLIAPPLA